MAPVILRMDVHCLGCARKIRKAIQNLDGVENVWASPDTGLVVVAGRADASALQSRIQYKMRRPVAIVSGGAVEQVQGYNPPYGGGMRHYVAPPPPAYYRYVPAAATRQYVGEPAVCFQDEKPNGCCVQ